MHVGLWRGSRVALTLVNLQRTGAKMAKRKSLKGPSKRVKRQGIEQVDEDSVHVFSDEEVSIFRRELLAWYDKNKRDLPWRRLSQLEDVNQRAYSVWVSEIMLQQTQVATVIDYYNKWIQKWPTLEDLAKAQLEEVNEMWSGLGYYSRGRRLHEGANKVVRELAGEMPRSAEELMKQLPGVGRYTAGAVASIAYNQVTGLVDGNVSRVFSRMRIIGADIGSQASIDFLWKTADQVVHPERPGDLNQALMELGATVCTPKSPSCATCPVKSICKAHKEVESHKKENASKIGQQTNSCISDIEDLECSVTSCQLCGGPDDSWDASLGVMNYPRKAKKKPPREERTAVCLFEREGDTESEYLIIQRPETGLLASLWEFPNVLLESEAPDCKDVKSALKAFIPQTFDVTLPEEKELNHIGEVVHIFSHIHQTYMLTWASIDADYSRSLKSTDRPSKWVTKSQFMEAAVSTAMKKVFKHFEASKNSKNNQGTKRKRDSVAVNAVGSDGKKQLGLMAFFKPKA